MVRTVYYVAASLDGFIADGSNAGTWGAEVRDVLSADAAFREFLAGVGALAMGAGTYRSYWETPGSWPYGKVPAWVFTHHEFPGIPGADVSFVRGDVAEWHPDIVYDAGPKDILLSGGGNLAAQFMDNGLLDEMVFTVVPVALGRGRPMLPVTRLTQPAVLLESRSLGHGLVQMRYAFQRTEPE